MAEQPAGTVTLLFTDIEGSTRLLDELGADRYRDALAEHRRLVRAAFERRGGYEVDEEGDAFFFAFASATEALAAAAEAQAALASGPIRVRMGLHTGEPLVDPPNYVGHGRPPGGADHVGGARRSGARLGDDRRPRQLAARAPGSRSAQAQGPDGSGAGVPAWRSGDFPPLKSLRQTNLPIQATPFVGREREVSEVVDTRARARHSDS